MSIWDVNAEVTAATRKAAQNLVLQGRVIGEFTSQINAINAATPPGASAAIYLNKMYPTIAGYMVTLATKLDSLLPEFEQTTSVIGSKQEELLVIIPQLKTEKPDVLAESRKDFNDVLAAARAAIQSISGMRDSANGLTGLSRILVAPVDQLTATLDRFLSTVRRLETYSLVILDTLK